FNLASSVWHPTYHETTTDQDALAQGDNGLGLMKNEDHQVLGNEQKLEEDASDCTRAGDETKKDKCSIFLLLLIICIVLMLINRASYSHSCGRLLLKAKADLSIGELTEFKSGLVQQGAGLDELNHDLSTKESVAQKSASESSYFVPGANIEPNKAGSEEVADLDPNQLPTSAFVGFSGPEDYLLILLRQDGAGDSGLGLSFDIPASNEVLPVTGPGPTRKTPMILPLEIVLALRSNVSLIPVTVREEDDGVIREVGAGNTNELNHVKPATKVGDDHLGITSLDKEGEVSVKNDGSSCVRMNPSPGFNGLVLIIISMFVVYDSQT
ncbi:hypothetical protein Tco_0760657, partial [Tanacetum coccineum]